MAAPQRVTKSNRTPISGVELPPVLETVEAEEGLTVSDGVRRVPLGQHVAKLALPDRPGFVRRWINDYPGRVQQAVNGGYEHIKDEKSQPLTRVVDKTSGLVSYAMEIPREFYDEDKRAKEESLDATDKTMHNGTFKQDPDSQTYGGIKFNVQRGPGKG